MREHANLLSAHVFHSESAATLVIFQSFYARAHLHQDTPKFVCIRVQTITAWIAAISKRRTIDYSLVPKNDKLSLLYSSCLAVSNFRFNLVLNRSFQEFRNCKAVACYQFLPLKSTTSLSVRRCFQLLFLNMLLISYHIGRNVSRFLASGFYIYILWWRHHTEQ